LGGGAFMNKMVRDRILQDSISIWLDLNIKELNKRISWNKKRPLINNDNVKFTIESLYAARKNIYKLASYKINCNNMSKASITKKIIYFYEKK